MRYLILCGLTMMLTGCINYYGMKNQVKPLNSAELSLTHPTHVQTKPSVSSKDWWLTFNDPQLNQLICRALSDSPTMQKAQSRVRMAFYLTKETAADLWPYIDLSGYRQRERFAQYGLIPPPFNGQTFNITELGLNFNYEFDFWGKNRQLLASSVNEQFAEKEDVKQAQLVISTTVANIYFQLQNLAAQLQLAKQLSFQQGEMLTITRQLEKRGLTSDIAVTTVIANYEAAKSNVIKLEEDKKLTFDRLAILLGKTPMELNIKIKPLIYKRYQVKTPTQLPANLLAERPDIKASCFRAKAAAHRINVAKARFFPNINLYALFSYQSINFGKFFEPSSQNNAISGAVDLPIFDAGTRRANLGVRYAEYDMAVSDYNQSILMGIQDVLDQVAILKSLRSQLHQENISVAAIKRKFTLMTSNYNNGIVNYTQLLESKNQYDRYRSAQIDLETRHLQAYVAMMKALGGQMIV